MADGRTMVSSDYRGRTMVASDAKKTRRNRNKPQEPCQIAGKCEKVHHIGEKEICLLSFVEREDSTRCFPSLVKRTRHTKESEQYFRDEKH